MSELYFDNALMPYKTDEQLMREKQEAYLKKLRQIRKAKESGENVDEEIGRIKEFWIGAGLLECDGKVNELYRDVIGVL